MGCGAMANGSLCAGDSTTRSVACGSSRRMSNNCRCELNRLEQTPRIITVLSTSASEFVTGNSATSAVRRPPPVVISMELYFNSGSNFTEQTTP